MNFREYLKEQDLGRASDLIYGEGGFLNNVKRFFTGNWIEPINADAKAGYRALKKHGFTDTEIKKIKDAVFIAVGEAIDKFGDPTAGRLDKSNFTGWIISVSHSASGGAFADKKVKEYIKKRVTEILKK